MSKGRRPGIVTCLSPVFIVATSFLTACAGSWVIGSTGTGAGNEDNEPAVIESLLERRYPELSPEIRSRIAEFSDGNARIAGDLCIETGRPKKSTDIARVCRAY